MTTDTPESRGAAPEPFTIWAMHTTFRKDGTPVMGSLGSTIRGVVVMTTDTWKRLCEAHPTLKTQEFRVGTFSDD